MTIFEIVITSVSAIVLPTVTYLANALVYHTRKITTLEGEIKTLKEDHSERHENNKVLVDQNKQLSIQVAQLDKTIELTMVNYKERFDRLETLIHNLTRNNNGH